MAKHKSHDDVEDEFADDPARTTHDTHDVRDTHDTHNTYNTYESAPQLEPVDPVALLDESLKGNILVNKLLLWVVQGLVTVLLIIGGYIMKLNIGRLDSLETTTKELQIWRAEVGGNRFTSADGLAVWKEIAAIKEHIAGLPNNLPPAWFVQRVDRLETALNANGQKLDMLNAEMQAHLRENPDRSK